FANSIRYLTVARCETESGRLLRNNSIPDHPVEEPAIAAKLFNRKAAARHPIVVLFDLCEVSNRDAVGSHFGNHVHVASRFRVAITSLRCVEDDKTYTHQQDEAEDDVLAGALEAG